MGFYVCFGVFQFPSIAGGGYNQPQQERQKTNMNSGFYIVAALPRENDLAALKILRLRHKRKCPTACSKAQHNMVPYRFGCAVYLMYPMMACPEIVFISCLYFRGDVTQPVKNATDLSVTSVSGASRSILPAGTRLPRERRQSMLQATTWHPRASKVRFIFPGGMETTRYVVCPSSCLYRADVIQPSGYFKTVNLSVSWGRPRAVRPHCPASRTTAATRNEPESASSNNMAP